MSQNINKPNDQNKVQADKKPGQGNMGKGSNDRQGQGQKQGQGQVQKPGQGQGGQWQQGDKNR